MARSVTRRTIAILATLAVVAVVAGIAGQRPVAAAGGNDARVRVNQVGYATAGPKRAFLLSAQTCEGDAFQVFDGGTEVFAGAAGPDRGPWNAAYPHVCAIVFDALTDPGTFTIAADGVMSPAFRVAEPADLYEPLVANALTFYLGQRDGADVDPSVLDRKPSHLHDRNAKVYAVPNYKGERLQGDLKHVGGPVDVEGGWFDAGDYVKFTGTTSFAVTLMLVAVRDHPSLFAGGGGPDFESEAERGVRWLLKMVDVPRRSLYYQVGIGSGGAGILADHDVWRLPEKDDGWTQHARRYLAHRPVLRVAPAGAKVPPSLAGRLASVFGLCAQLWPGTPLATKCLHEGQVVFSMAKTKDVEKQITSSPIGYYREDEWRDDLEMGATQLYLGLSEPGAPAPEPRRRRLGTTSNEQQGSPTPT